MKQTPQDFLLYRISIVRYLLEAKCFQGKPGPLPSRPLADLDAMRLNNQYHSVGVEEKRRDCVVCAKIVSVRTQAGVHSPEQTRVCYMQPETICILSHPNCWEEWHNLVEYWR